MKWIANGNVRIADWAEGCLRETSIGKKDVDAAIERCRDKPTLSSESIAKSTTTYRPRGCSSTPTLRAACGLRRIHLFSAALPGRFRIGHDFSEFVAAFQLVTYVWRVLSASCRRERESFGLAGCWSVTTVVTEIPRPNDSSPRSVCRGGLPLRSQFASWIWRSSFPVASHRESIGLYSIFVSPDRRETTKISHP